MTSTERRKNRYIRRKQKREKKREDRIRALGTFEDIFSYQNLYNSFYHCKQGVRWKSSIQSYEANLPINISDIYLQLNNGTWKTKGFTTFRISERGKMRTIQSVHISERCIQRCFCDNYLIPAILPSLIYDNGASLKGKGTSFALERMKKHLRYHYRKYGNKGYIVTFDFSNYFGNISHEKLYGQLDKFFIDERLKALFHQLVDAFDEGLGLGSQVSQISAVAFANKIDHYFKNKLRISGYGRYMDDIYIIENDKNKIREYINIMKEMCDGLGIKLNHKKIKVTKISHGFTFLKKRFSMTDTGKIVIRLSRNAIFAAKRRLKKMYEKYLNNILSYEEILQAYKSWKYSVLEYKTYHALKRMDVYFNTLFINSFIKGVQS